MLTSVTELQKKLNPAPGKFLTFEIFLKMSEKVRFDDDLICWDDSSQPWTMYYVATLWYETSRRYRLFQY